MIWIGSFQSLRSALKVAVDEGVFVAESHGDVGKVRSQSRRLDPKLKANAIIPAESGAL
jgi:hypothetical protein